jgi:hypothetical protein
VDENGLGPVSARVLDLDPGPHRKALGKPARFIGSARSHARDSEGIHQARVESGGESGEAGLLQECDRIERETEDGQSGTVPGSDSGHA